ncbi:hypothetical protein SCWH03_26190 [Streptomyces pacificus]|uniref:Uncharacterized protein n=1 Tax=Streptomyces pacificus TaxID=2705029 RepID=A0A6A0AVN1_9ACTN|nr:hypothetical protein SCWH03_26190 [Streptomyces pacificus]
MFGNTAAGPEAGATRQRLRARLLGSQAQRTRRVAAAALRRVPGGRPEAAVATAATAARTRRTALTGGCSRLVDLDRLRRVQIAVNRPGHPLDGLHAVVAPRFR